MEASALRAPAGLGTRRSSSVLLRLRSDEQLVALFRQGNDDAFRVIHDRYRQRLTAYSRQMLGGSGSDADDAMQDVFLRAYAALRADDRPVTLRAWLYRVAHNRCIDHIRRPSSQATVELSEEGRPLAALGADPLAAAERREQLRRLIDDVRDLPEQQRSALLMREMEGLSYQELAAALDVTIPAVKSLLVRARMGLVEAQHARDTPCAEIREDITSAHDRGVRMSGRARRHARECPGCAGYRTTLKAIGDDLGALNPGAGPWGFLAKLIGLGAGGSGAAGGAAAAGGAGAGAAGAGVAGFSAAGATGTVAAGAAATKLAAVVCCAAVLGGGAVEVARDHGASRDRAAASTDHHAAPLAPASPADATRLAAGLRATPFLTAAGATKGSAAHRAGTGARRRAAHFPSVITLQPLVGLLDQVVAPPAVDPDPDGGSTAPAEPGAPTGDPSIAVDPDTGVVTVTPGGDATGSGDSTGTAGSTSGASGQGSTTAGGGSTGASGSTANGTSGTTSGSGASSGGSTGSGSTSSTSGSGTTGTGTGSGSGSASSRTPATRPAVVPAQGTAPSSAGSGTQAGGASAPAG